MRSGNLFTTWKQFKLNKSKVIKNAVNDLSKATSEEQSHRKL